MEDSVLGHADTITESQDLMYVRFPLLVAEGGTDNSLGGGSAEPQDRCESGVRSLKGSNFSIGRFDPFRVGILFRSWGYARKASLHPRLLSASPSATKSSEPRFGFTTEREAKPQ